MFQALRIAVNAELDDLRVMLKAAKRSMRASARNDDLGAVHAVGFDQLVQNGGIDGIEPDAAV